MVQISSLYDIIHCAFELGPLKQFFRLLYSGLNPLQTNRNARCGCRDICETEEVQLKRSEKLQTLSKSSSFLRQSSMYCTYFFFGAILLCQ